MFDEMKKMVDDFTKEADEFIARYKARAEELEKIGNSDNSEKFPKDGDEYWYMDDLGDIANYCYYNDVPGCIRRKRVGNCFKTMREAEQAVEKLKAWKRLKDAGISFDLPYLDGPIYFGYDNSYDGIENDLKLIFGGDDE